ncbi:unnamed protein product [Symbiodinium sp. CCMP2592]|nr:unnamed protein product [Symbiodinium sp. CCMP2592]
MPRWVEVYLLSGKCLRFPVSMGAFVSDVLLVPMKEEIDQKWTIKPAHQVLFCLSTARRAPSKLYDSERLCNLQAVEDTLQLQVVIVGGSAQTFRRMSLQPQVVRPDHGVKPDTSSGSR